MCRVLAYLGAPISLAHVLYETDSSLVRQSYSPRMMSTFRSLAAKLAPTCLIAHVRGVTDSEHEMVAETALHPFRFYGARVALAHNGHLRDFARMRFDLVRHIGPELAQRIEGTTDS